MTDVLGQNMKSIFDLPQLFDEISAGMRAKVQDDFTAMGIALKQFMVVSINPTEETAKAIDERSSMGAIGDMNKYMQYKTAQAVGDAAKSGGGTGEGLGLGAGIGMAGVSGSADGTGTAALFRFPTGIAVDASGNLYVSDSGSYTIRKITPAGLVSTLAGMAGVTGSADGVGGAARFNVPLAVTADPAGNLYVSDTLNRTIRKITPAGLVSTLAGTPGLAGSDDGTGPAARFQEPLGIALDSAGNVYVADDQRIRKITPGGAVTSVAGSGVIGNFPGAIRGVTVISTDKLAVTTAGFSIIGVNFDGGFQYDFTGFAQPVDNPPTVNTVRAGSAVPLKFSLAGDKGLAVLAPGYPRSQPVLCSTTAPVAAVTETVSAGGSSLTYDALADRYTYVWKTDKAWADTCRQLTVRLSDGSDHTALFRFGQ